MMWNVISQVIGTGFKVMQTRSQTKQMQALAEQKHYEKMVEGEIKYEVAKQNAMDNSWRDEWFTIILSLPLLIVFGSVFFNKPEWITKLKEGFETLNQLPDWYIYALLAAIASSFGMKVTDLAIEIGKSYGKDVKLDMVGIRPGEKLHEEMVSLEESLRVVPYEKYFMITDEVLNKEAWAFSSDSVVMTADEVGSFLKEKRVIK